MKLAISNIAWPPHDAPKIYAAMRAAGFSGLEIAPGLAFADEPDPWQPAAGAVRAFREALHFHGLAAVSMQSLLFGVEGAQLFGSEAERATFDRAMRRSIGFAAELGIANLVFGSPRNRAYPVELGPAQAIGRAIETFAGLGELAAELGATIAIEPNPACYGTNFLTTVEETARFVKAVAHPAIRLNFDIGALLINHEVESLPRILELADGLISHVHVSEPELAPAPSDPATLTPILLALERSGYQGWVSIEMRCVAGDPLPIVIDCMDRLARVAVQVEGMASA